MKRTINLLALLALVAGVTTACNPVTPYAAIVNGHTISNSLINDELHAITSNPRYAASLDQQLSAGSGAGGLQPAGSNSVNSTYVAQLVYNRVLVSLIDDAVKQKNLTVTKADIKNATDAEVADFNDTALYDSLPQSYKDYLIGRQASLNVLTASFDTPEKEQAYYDANPAAYTTACASHILVQTQAQAQSLRDQIAAGADFATLAKANSIDTGSGASGGDLGCALASTYVAPFANALATMAPNTLSEPVQTQYGWHVIKVTTVTKQSLAEAEPTIKKTLADPTAFFSDALGKAKVKVNPRYGDYVAGDAATGTVAHIVPHPANALEAATATAATTAGSGLTDQTGTADTSGATGTTPDTSGATPDTSGATAVPTQ